MLYFEFVMLEKFVCLEEVYMVVVFGIEGDFGVLEGYVLFMLMVCDGGFQVFCIQNGILEVIVIQGGFVEVNVKGLIVLVEYVE